MRADAPPTLAVLIERIAAELAREAQAVRGLHPLVESTDGADAVRLAQTIDIAPQHLDELAGLLARLARTVPATMAGDPALASGIRLSALRDRLFGASGEDEADAGELDLF